MNKVLSYAPLLLIVIFMLSLSGCKEDPVSVTSYGNISGQVIDTETGTGIANVNITTSPGTNSIITASDGTFMLEGVEVGSYTISATRNGYQRKTVTISVRENETTPAAVFMEKESTSNSAPNPPENPSPANAAVDQRRSFTLSWTASDPDTSDSLLYDVLLYEPNSPVQRTLVSDHPDTSIMVNDLDFSTTYFWQVIAKDSTGATANSTVWSFSTEPLPDLSLLYASRVEGDYNIFSYRIANDDSEASASDTLQLTTGTSRDWWPRMSPNRDKIAFVSNSDIEPQIYTINRDGSDLFKVTSLAIAGFHNPGIGFSWSPDGTQLVYSHYETLYRIDADRGNLTNVSTAPINRHFREVDWSPLGDIMVALAMGSNIYDSEIYLIDADRGSHELLVDNLPGMLGSPSFSPDGNSVMYTHDVSGHEVPDGRQLDTRIFIKNIAAGDSLDVSSSKPAGTNDIQPRFSPDGASIIFSNVPNDGSSATSVWTMDLNGDNRTRILSEGEMADWR